MAKHTSTLQHSKQIENRVAHYLFGPDNYRVWEARHDIEGQAQDVTWYGEVKDLSLDTICPGPSCGSTERTLAR